MDDHGASADAVWREIPGRPCYKVSDHGQVKNVTNGRILVGDVDRYGYRRILLGRGNRAKIHRLVCEAFHGQGKAGQEVRHLDGDCSNNRAENLAWGTRSDNVRDAVTHGTHRFVIPTNRRGRPGETNSSAKLSQDKVRAIRAFARAGESERKIAASFGMSPGQIHKIISGEAWAHVKD